MTFHCPLCRYSYTKPIAQNNVIEGWFAFHMYDTHGIPTEVLPAWLTGFVETQFQREMSNEDAHNCQGAP